MKKKKMPLIIILFTLTALFVFLLAIKIEHLCTYGLVESYMKYETVVLFTVIYSVLVLGCIVWLVFLIKKGKKLEENQK